MPIIFWFLMCWIPKVAMEIPVSKRNMLQILQILDSPATSCFFLGLPDGKPTTQHNTTATTAQQEQQQKKKTTTTKKIYHVNNNKRKHNNSKHNYIRINIITTTFQQTIQKTKKRRHKTNPRRRKRKPKNRLARKVGQ